MEIEIDVDNQSAVLDAARPFDNSYVDGRSIIMLAGTEIFRFGRHIYVYGVRNGCASIGRRSRDHAMADRIAYLEKEVERLQAVVQLADQLRNRERRKAQMTFEGADKRRAPRDAED